jgi:hypothetical protein
MRAPHTLTSLAVIAATASVAATPATPAHAATQRHTGPVAASAKRKARHYGPVLALTKQKGGPVSLAATSAELSRTPGTTTAPCKGAGPLTRGPEFISRRHRLQLMSTSATCIGDLEY